MNRIVLFTAIFVLLMTDLHVQAQLIVAHRGASHDAPENTMAAFNLAWEQNADAIEADFHLSADNQIICIHDKTTERTCLGYPNSRVADLNLAELRKLDAGSWKSDSFSGELIPTLDEVLSTVPEGKQIFLEIKCGLEIVPHLVTSLNRSHLEPSQVVIICFNKTVVQSIRKELPLYKCNWLTSYKAKNDQTELSPNPSQIMKNLIDLKATGLGSQFNQNIVNDSMVQEFQSAGFEFHVWTVDDPTKIEAAVNLHVDSITTNRPATAIKIRENSSSAQNGLRRPWGLHGYQNN